ncbi:peroxidase P7-like [Aristolochia californica]|uniref:peroxidase P7-like n=1 Tax=Aristolochia californica TaxID=171875 RepID=UPI0035DF78A1
MASYHPFNLVIVFLCLFEVSLAQLSTSFYSTSCPQVASIVKKVVDDAIEKETRMGASLLRLHFHDCFVNGCDGSILLDDTPNFTGEKSAIPNLNSLRGYDVVDNIKAAVEKACPGVVSCADILALAAHESVVELGGPSWGVLLGRRDSKTASQNAANSNIPPPTSSLSNLISNFSSKGLSAKDLVALSGSHSIGLARCTVFRNRIYNDTNIDSTFAGNLQKKCPALGRNHTLSRLDAASPNRFDNCYYRNLLNQKGLLHSDQELVSGTATATFVKKYVSDPSDFFQDFATAMVKMGNIGPLTGKSGEVRKNCRKAN